MGFIPQLCLVSSMSSGGILMVQSILISKVRLSPRLYVTFEIFHRYTSWLILTLWDMKTSAVLLVGQILLQTITNRIMWILAVLNDDDLGSANFCGPEFVILMIVHLLHSEQLLVCKEYALHTLYNAVQWSTAPHFWSTARCITWWHFASRICLFSSVRRCTL